MTFFNSAQIEALSKGVVRLGTLAELQFKTGPVYIWNGDTPLDHAGKNWLPLYGQGMVDGIPVLGQGSAESLTLTLNGVDGEHLRLALQDTDDVSQQFMILYTQTFNEDWQPVGQPVAIFYGFMQPPRVSRSPALDGQEILQTITVECLNAFYNRSRPAFGRYTDTDQKRRSPGDSFFSFASTLVSKQVKYPDF